MANPYKSSRQSGIMVNTIGSLYIKLHTMNKEENKYSNEWIRKFQGLENLTDEEAAMAISSLKKLLGCVLSLERQSMLDIKENTNQKLLQAA